MTLSSRTSGQMSESRVLVESQRYLFDLDEAQVAALQTLRTSLQGSQVWWGAKQDFDEEPGSPVRIALRGRGQYEVIVSDAIGALALPRLDLIVVPKIKQEHFTYIAARAFGHLRTDASELALASGASFKDAVAGWFVSSVERLVRTSLNVDYQTILDEQRILRGALRAEPTLRRWMTGHVDLVCEFDELTVNTALNRVIKSALENVGHNTTLSPEVTRRARVMLLRFRSVGQLVKSDFFVVPTRGERRYRRALELARSVLASTGRSLRAGPAASNTFLFRTPDLIEEGIRRILADALRPIRVQKRGRVLVPSAERVMPDLELASPPFTGDVKYKITNGKWKRPDLAQAVLFAAAYRSPRALVLGFGQDPDVVLDRVPVGDIEVVSALWDASGVRTPVEAERHLVRAVRRFLPPQIH